MHSLPDNFDPCEIEIQSEDYGILGIIIGQMFHYPCWIGILEPSNDLNTQLENLLFHIETSDISIRLRNQYNDEVWEGSISDIRMPDQGHPYIELKWYDTRKPF